MGFVIPFGNKVSDIIYLYFGFMNQVIFSIMRIQVVYNKNTVRFQRFRNGSYRIIMLSPRIKISKAGKKVKRIIKIIYPERKAHIMNKKLQIFRFEFFRFPDAVT